MRKEYKIRRIRVKRRDSEIELEFETPVTLEEAENATSSALDKLLAVSTTTPPSVTPETSAPTAKVVEEYPSISKPVSCPDAITKLLSTGWGKTPRTKAELRNAMAYNAVYYPDSSLRSKLTRMTHEGKLRRVKKGNVYAYVLP